MPAGRGSGQEVRLVVIELAAHRRERDRGLPQGIQESVDRHIDHPMPLRQCRDGASYQLAELTGQLRYDDIRRNERHSPVCRQRMMRHAAMPGPGIGLAQPKRRDRPAAQHSGGVHRLAGRNPAESPAGARAEIARPLCHDHKICVEDVPCRQQA